MFLLKKITKLSKHKLWIKGLLNGIAATIELENLLKNINLETVIDVGSNKGQFIMLIEKLYPNKVIEPVIQRCYKNDLLNDQRFSDMWVESRNTSRPKSALMVKKELLSKGISEDISLSATKSISDSQNAAIAAHKKSRALRYLPEDKFYEKLIAHLLRKGFSHYTSKIATDTAWEKLDNS